MKKLCNRLVILFAVLLALPVCAENKFCEVGFKEISSSEGHDGAGIINVIRDGYIRKPTESPSSTVLIPKTARHT